MTDLHQRNGDTKESIDYVLLILVLLLVVFGLVVLYSTSAYNGRVKFADPAYYLRKQFFATSIGLFSMYLVSRKDYRRLQNYGWSGYGMALDPNGGWHWALCPSSLLSTQNWRWSFCWLLL